MSAARPILVLIALAILATAAAAVQPNYVDLTPRLEKWYHADNSLKCNDLRLRTVIVGQFDGAVEQRLEIRRGDEIVSARSMLFTRTDEGDILYHGDPAREVFIAPIVWIDAPLVVGKTWTGATGDPAKDSGMTHWVFAVLEEDEIICPAGSFPCHRVFVATIYPDGTTENCNFWYNPQCGLIRCHADGEATFALSKAQILDDPDIPDVKPHDATVLTDVRSGPNPFNPTTTIRFELGKDALVSVDIHDVSGRLVRQLVRAEHQAAGPCAYSWDGRDGAGRDVASGAYFARVKAGDTVANKRMMLVR